MVSIIVEVQKSDLDDVYLHLHHAKIVLYLELGRLKFLEATGFPSEYFTSRKLLPIVSRIDLSFVREICEGMYTVTCRTQRTSRKIIVFSQEICDHENKVCTRAEVSCMLIDGNLRTAVSFPQELIDQASV